MRATQSNENVLLDCGFAPADAENLRLRAEMMIALSRHIEEKGLSQARAAKIMGVSQPRISSLARGKIGLFTIDALVNMLAATGLVVDLYIRHGRPRAKRPRVA
jgi:predicted XRE-type DNA-binding protein